MKVTNAWWTGNVLTAVQGTGENANLVEHKADHCFFLRNADVTPELRRELISSRLCLGLKEEGQWIRTSWRYDRPVFSKPASHIQVAKFVEDQRKIKTFEADVSPARRWIVEQDIEIDRPKRCYLDIETDSRVPFSRKAEARVLCWVVIGEGDGSDVHAGVLADETDEAESDLLLTLWQTLQRYDQVLSWNGDRFDFPMIQDRSKKVGLQGESRRWLWLDHLVLFRRMNMSAAESGDEKQSMSLESVARSVLGEGKLHGVSGSESWNLWAGGPVTRGKLLDYCAQDTDLMRKIEGKTGYIELLQTLAEATHVFPDTYGISPSGQVESFLMRLAKKRDLRFPSHFHTEWSEKFAGAYVMDPIAKGIERNVHVADFARLYPSIILSWNMSLETYCPNVRLKESAQGRPSYLAHVPLREYPLPEGHCVAALTDCVFANEPRGILPDAIEEMIRLRAVWNKKKAAATPGTTEWVEADRRSSAYKMAANSFYGVIGMPHSRFYVRGVAESVSQCGVWLIQQTRDAAIAKGYNVLYCDTDSIFVSNVGQEEFAAFVKWCNLDLYPGLMSSKGCSRNYIELAYEKAFERITFTSAKRYVGKYSHYKGTIASADSKPEIKGLEYKRGDVSRLTRQLQGEVIDLLMSGEEPPAADAFVHILERWKIRILEETLERSDIVLAKRLAKPLSEYKRRTKLDGNDAAEPPHVAVARRLKEKGMDVGEGTKIEYIVTDGQSSPMQVVSVGDWDGAFDRYYLWESLVFPPTQRLLTAAYPGVDWKKWERVRPVVPRVYKPRPKKTDEKQGNLFAPRNDDG
jgi:DNA polymerase elongation subunit (family B)